MLDVLRTKCENGEVSHEERFSAWQQLLGVDQATQEQRYAELTQKYTTAPDQEDNDDPLSDKPDSAWRAFFDDEALRDTIRLDLTRTHQGSELFKCLPVQECMLRVLFLWAKMNPTTSYRQGMHELLAVLVYVALQPQSLADEPVSNEQTLLHEPALFASFEALMCRMLPFYLVTKRRRGEKPQEGQPKLQPLQARCERMQRHLLPQVDKALSKHIEDSGVEPPVYALRWVRLLFAREFHLRDTACVWDVLFARWNYQEREETVDGDSDFLDYMCVALLCYIREQLIHGDYTQCMRRLMKYPPVEDVAVIAQQAVHFAEGGTVSNVENESIVANTDGVPHTCTYANSNSNSGSSSIPVNNNSSNNNSSNNNNSNTSSSRTTPSSNTPVSSGSSIVGSAVSTVGTFLRSAMPTYTPSQTTGTRSRGTNNLRQTLPQRRAVQDEEMRQMRRVQRELARRIDGVVEHLQRREITDHIADTHALGGVLQAIAHMKQVREVLRGTLMLDDCSWIIGGASVGTYTAEDVEDIVEEHDGNGAPNFDDDPLGAMI
ncbi:MAG: hypothetical protein MHM6MM_004889 [Cercozoa sp. M6MM]